MGGFLAASYALKVVEMPSGPNEAKTRKDLIDPALNRAGWDVDNPELVRLEIPVDGFDPKAWQAIKTKLGHIGEAGNSYNADLPIGISDYALYRPNGEVIAIVEAKRTSTDPRLAQAQAEFYVTELAERQSFQPFAFMTNGYDIYFLDAGQANKRMVAGFFSPGDLENLLSIRQNKQPLAQAVINTSITDRPYQIEAIRRVCETFEQNKRKALLIMATGTGKTRTVMSLVDIFLNTHQARRVLFVADRDPLVQQALDDGFKRFLPNEPNIRIATYTPVAEKQAKRLYVSTLQTLNICYQEFTPGFFDLIIFDEVHRSIFNKWNEVLQYFDARMIGLTATPADFVDRNTFLAFDCADGTPTFLYTYKQAVKDKYLVDYKLWAAKTRFQRRGIQGIDLSEEERNALIEQGIDPDDLNFAGTDLEKNVSNKDTLRKQWQEIMDQCLKDQSGQLPGKTIVFAMTQDHALRLAEVFEEMYPQWPGLASVITHSAEYKGDLIRKFKKEDYPRIAITVDLLETGIDVPEVVNLIFMKPVHSRIKLEQMIGRGTRSNETCTYYDRLPNGHKTEFLIIDFWENDFNRSADEEIAQSLPVLVTLFNTRLKLLAIYLDKPQSAERERLISQLRAQIAAIPIDSFSIKRVLPEVEIAWGDSFWLHLTPDKLDFLKLKVGSLLRYVSLVDVQASTFTSKVERLRLQVLTGKDATSTAESIAEDVSRLPDFVWEDPQRKPLLGLCLSPQLQSANADDLNKVTDLLADQMKYRREKPNAFLMLDLPDYIEMRGFILLKGGTERVYVDEYKRRVEQGILELVESDPTIQAIGHGEPVTDKQLIELERTLQQTLGGAALELSEDNIRKAYGMKVGSLLEFLRELFDLDGVPDYGDIVRRQFEAFIATHPFNADQVMFLRTVQSVFLQKRHMQLPDLYDAPSLTHFGDNAVERWFTGDQITEILAFTDSLAA